MDGYNTHTHKQSKHTQKEREITRKSSFLRRRQQPTPPNAKKIESRFLLIFPSWSWNRFFATHPSKEERKARNDATVGRVDGCTQQSFLDYIYIVHLVYTHSVLSVVFSLRFAPSITNAFPCCRKLFFRPHRNNWRRKRRRRRKKFYFFARGKKLSILFFFLSFSLTKTRRRKDTRFGS